MRRRLVGAIVLVAIATLALYAVPRTVMVEDLVRNAERRALWNQVPAIARTIDERLAAGRPLDRALVDELAGPDQQVVVELPDGAVMSGRELTGDVLVATEPLASGGVVRLRIETDSVDDRVRSALWPVLLIGLGAVVAAVALALAVSRRVVRPFTALADHAADLGPEIHDPAPRSGLPEADRIASALDSSRDRLAQLLSDEREFSANASHQLRTPLAALRLRLEDLTLWSETDDAVRDELVNAMGEVDRLSGTIDDLLSLARRGGLGTAGDVELGRAATEAADRWRGAFDDAGRSVAVRSPGPVAVPASAGAVLQVLDVLLENALVHGKGDVTVTVADGEGHGSVCVADSGSVDASVVDDLFERSRRGSGSAGEGIGLALARTLAGAVGARLRLVSTAPTTFELTFSSRPN